MKKSVPSEKPTTSTAELDLNSVDFLDDLEFPNDSMVTVKAEVPNLSDTNQTGVNESNVACGESHQKTLIQRAVTVMNRQLDASKKIDEKMLNNLSDLLEDCKADYNFLKENEQLMGLIVGLFMKRIRQYNTACEENLKSLIELYDSFKKRYEDMDQEQRGEMENLAKELEEDISMLKKKIIEETKRGQWEELLKFYEKAMQDNI